MNTNWENDYVQFPRLIAEVSGILDHDHYVALASSMDLTVADVTELFERAERVWEALNEAERRQR